MKYMINREERVWAVLRREGLGLWIRWVLAFCELREDLTYSTTLPAIGGHYLLS